jgi:hypothetical protein
VGTSGDGSWEMKARAGVYVEGRRGRLPHLV